MNLAIFFLSGCITEVEAGRCYFALFNKRLQSLVIVHGNGVSLFLFKVTKKHWQERNHLFLKMNDISEIKGEKKKNKLWKYLGP